MKNFVGNGKVIKTEYGSLLNVGLNLEELKKLPTYKGYIRLTIGKKKQEDQFGNTHAVWENEYGKNKDQQDTNNEEVSDKDDFAGDDLPF